MTQYLALDIGRRRTGIAFADARVNVAMPLETIHHEDDDELLDVIAKLIFARNASTIVVGLPYLMNGKEGEEAVRVRSVATRISDECPDATIVFIDERETSKFYSAVRSKDSDAQAATAILRIFLERKDANPQS